MRKKTINRVLSIPLCIVFFFCFVAVAAAGSEPLKIKGFYIGMDIEEALKNFERLGFEGLSIREQTYKKVNTYYAIRPGSGDPFKVETGLNVKTVSKIYFSSAIADRLFNTAGISAEIFKDSLADAYRISPMDPFAKNPASNTIEGWEHYDLDRGYRIRVSTNKDVDIMKTARRGEFQFD